MKKTKALQPYFATSTNQFSDKYEQDDMTTSVIYDEIADGYICAYCAEDLGLNSEEIKTHQALLSEYEGGGHLSSAYIVKRKTKKTLAHYDCLQCDLPVSRSFD
jgi:hypothetical protein